jgi:5-methylcytosine-specific restriction protein B
MSSTGPHESSGTTWFVGASIGHTDDQSTRFLEEGL